MVWKAAVDFKVQRDDLTRQLRQEPRQHRAHHAVAGINDDGKRPNLTGKAEQPALIVTHQVRGREDSPLNVGGHSSSLCRRRQSLNLCDPGVIAYRRRPAPRDLAAVVARGIVAGRDHDRTVCPGGVHCPVRHRSAALADVDDVAAAAEDRFNHRLAD